MTLYELLKKVSSILAKDNADKLFEYTIHSMDYNGGFLRSRYCYWESDYEIGKYYYVREVAPQVTDRLVGMTYDESIRYVIGIDWSEDTEEPTISYYNYDTTKANGIGTAFAEPNTEPTMVFNNRYTEGVTSTPEIILSGDKDLIGRPWTDADRFRFDLYLTDADFKTDGHPVLMTDYATKGEPSILFEGITFDSVGTKYLVIKETAGDRGGVTYDTTVYHVTVTVVKAEDENGMTILSVDPSHGGNVLIHRSGENAAIDADEINFTNHYAISDSTSVIIRGEKTLNGRNLLAGEFSFALYPEGSTEAISIVTNRADGSFAFPMLTYHTPGTHTYVVKELAGAQNLGLTYDTKTYTIKVVISDNGEGGLNQAVTVDGIPATEEVLIDTVTATEVKVGFTNTYAAEATELVLSGKKILDGRDLREGEFTFRLFRADSAFHELDETPILTVTNLADGTYSMTLKFTDGQEGRYYYILSEEVKQTDKQGVGYDTREYFITVLVSDDGRGNLHSSVSSITSSGYNGQITNGNINFRNTYTAASVDLTLGGSKEYNRELSEGMFEFILTTPSTTESLQKVENQADGRFTFAPLTFTEPGTYEYYVSEVNGGSTIQGITYDNEKYKVVVTVSDPQDGQLIINSVVITDKNGQRVEKMLFTNIYEADASDEIFIHGIKNLIANGRDLRADEFEFELYHSNESYEKLGNAIATAKNQADGTFTFANPLTFTEVGTYYYLVTEKNLGQDGMLYDNTDYIVVISVEDDGNGKLVAGVQYRIPTAASYEIAENIEFTNVYTPKPASLLIEGTKVLTGRDLAAEEFVFELFAADENFAPIGAAALATAKNGADGSFHFEEVSFNEAGTHYFLVTEKNTEIERVTYDNTTYGITVEVGIDSNGDFVVREQKITNRKNNEEKEEILFTNIYTPRPEDISFAIEIEKLVENLGGESIGPEGFTFELKEVGTDRVLRETTNADGEARFEFTFTEEDIDKVYHFKLSEVNDHREHVTYSTKEYDVTIHISLREDNVLVAQGMVDGIAVDVTKATFTNIYDYTEVPPVPEVPKLGDVSGNWQWIALLFVSGVLMTGLGLKKKIEE